MKTISDTEFTHLLTVPMLHAEIDKLKGRLAIAVEALESIRLAPGPGGLDFPSTKKYLEGTLKVISMLAKEAITKLRDAEGRG